MTSPTQRTTAKLRAMGYSYAIVERWNQYARIRQDLFGFIDVLGLGNGETLAIQTTTTGTAARQAKILEAAHLSEILRSGWIVETWGWRKINGRRKGARMLWALRRMRLVNGTWVEIVEPEPEDFDQ